MQSFLAWRQGLQINFPSESPAPCRLSGPGKRGVLGLRSNKIAVISSSYNFVAECGSRLPQGYGSLWDRTAVHLPREGETRLQLEGGEIEAETRY